MNNINISNICIYIEGTNIKVRQNKTYISDSQQSNVIVTYAKYVTQYTSYAQNWFIVVA